MRKFGALAFSSMLAAVLMTFSASAAMAQEQRVSIPSNKSFEQTIDAFKTAVSKGGMMIMSTVDQGNMLKMTGLQMKGTLFLVGNPTVGKQVFEKDPGAGLYLPLRVYIYQASDGKTYLSYDKPSSVLKPFNNSEIDQTATMLDQKLAMLTQMVAH
jgi:uncharacterized protein (DUF302 family)